jgi:predicted metal-binding membrane protein
MRRWRKGATGAINMGIHHGLSCVGCCLPYCLLVALGWMNLLWMGLFACIIFGEKIWSRGIWIAKSAGIGLAVTGIITLLGLVTIPRPSKHIILVTIPGNQNCYLSV